jgi:hypothetical protein
MRKSLVIVAVAGLALSVAAFAANAQDAKKPGGSFVGSTKCKMCHSKEYKAWALTKHAHAFESLKTATPEQLAKMNTALSLKVTGDASQSKDCVKCHVTGFGAPGGYPSPDSVKNVVLAAVSCEDCHGPAGNHMAVPMADKPGRAATMVKPTVEQCMECHTKALTPDFNFDERAKKVHPVPAAAVAPAK